MLPQSKRKHVFGYRLTVGLACCTLTVGQLVGLSGCATEQQESPPRKPLEFWLAKTKSSDPDEKIIALEALGQYPDHASQIFYPLLDGIVDLDSLAKAAAERSIRQIGEPLAQHAISLLDTEDPKVLAAACEMIHRLGPAGKTALPKLLELVDTDWNQYRKYVLFAAVPLQSDHPRLLEYAIRGLDDSEFQIQVLSLDILRGYGPAAHVAFDQVLQLSKTGNPSTRIHALSTLAAIGPVGEFDLVSFLVERLETFLQPEREGALKALAILGPQAAAAEDVVRKLIYDIDRFNQAQAALTLWKITGRADETIDALVSLGASVEFEEEAIFALNEMGPAAKPATKFVAQRLETEDDSWRLALLGVLENIGGVNQAKREIRQLAESDENILVRNRARRLLNLPIELE